MIKNIKHKIPQNVQDVLESINRAAGPEYANRIFLVGGIVRGAVMDIPFSQDVDIVVDGDVEELVKRLRPLAEHSPVVYGGFGTAMLTIRKVKVEFVAARKEAYRAGSRKPVVSTASIHDDIMRRDFTINTLMADISTYYIIDLTGRGLSSIYDKVIRTPVDPNTTFNDDPLRMLRAVRFSCRFGFTICPEIKVAIRANAHRLMIVSRERVRDELNKMLLGPQPDMAIRKLLDLELLEFTPLARLKDGFCLEQSKYHIYDVFEHVMQTVKQARELYFYRTGGDPSLELMWAALLHDVGKPYVRSVDEKDPSQWHFYQHDEVGTSITDDILHQLKMPEAFISKVKRLVAQHMRAPDKQWHRRAIRRFAVRAHEVREDLLYLMAADSAAGNPQYDTFDFDWVTQAIEDAMALIPANECICPLDGREIMQETGIEPGPKIGEIKKYIADLIIDGRIEPGDKAAAATHARLYLEGVKLEICNREPETRNR
jgi:poly(A) polymerase